MKMNFVNIVQTTKAQTPILEKNQLQKETKKHFLQASKTT